MDFYAQKTELEEIKTSVEASAEAINIPALSSELSELKAKQASEEFWQNQSLAKSVNMRVATIEKKINHVSDLKQRVENAADVIKLAEELQDDEYTQEITNLLRELRADSEKLFLETLLSGKYDANNAILTIQAGAGGTEAQDWVQMLYRMYQRYAETAEFSTEVLDYQPGDEAGIKSVTFQLSGENAYGFLKAEKGVHRLVRISPFDSGKRRHTSFASLEVMPEITDDTDIVIKPEELKVDVFRSSGAGGQHVNKTSSAVRMTHIPTGIITTCQNERSQIQNRETALKMLKAKLVELKESQREEETSKLRGDIKKIEWGSQIRSYVFCPYTLVKDHRTGYETGNISAVMDGEIEGFIFDYLIKTNSNAKK